MPRYPHGSLPGEIDGTHVHVPKRAWHLLRKDPGFLKNWNRSKADRPYHIAVSCLTRGLTDDQTVTVVRIWHQKHGHTFSEDNFRTWDLVAAAFRATPFVYRYEANAYWQEVRRIMLDTRTRQHSKLRVSYFLMNLEQATAKEIAEEALRIAAAATEKFLDQLAGLLAGLRGRRRRATSLAHVPTTLHANLRFQPVENSFAIQRLSDRHLRIRDSHLLALCA